jgi:hypothetical protein
MLLDKLCEEPIDIAVTINPKLGRGRSFGFGSNAHHQIVTRPRFHSGPRPTKRLAPRTFDEVTAHRAWHIAFWDNQPQSPAGRVPYDMERKELAAQDCATRKTVFKLPG